MALYLTAYKVKLTSRLGYIYSQMSQLLRLVTQMYDNEAVTNIIYSTHADNGTLDCGSRSAEYFGAADWRWIFVLGSYFYFLYFRYL